MYHIDRLNESNVRLLSILSGLAFIFVSVKLWDYGLYLISLPTFFVGIIAILISANKYSIPIRRRGNCPQSTGFSLGSESSKILWLRLTEKAVGWFLVVVSAILSISGFMLFDRSAHGAGWTCYMFSMLAILVVPFLFRGSRISASKPLINSRLTIPVLATFLITGVVILGFVLRVYNISELPAGLWYDEADNIVRAGQIHASPMNTPVFVPSTHLPSAFLVPVAMLQELTGVLWLNGRLVSAGFSLILILAMFYFAKDIFGTFWGLGGAFLVSIMRWSLNWGRIGMHGITAAVFSALTGFLLWRSLVRWSPFWFFWTGLALGIGMWFYAPFRLFPVVILIGVGLRICSGFPGWRKLVDCLMSMAFASIISTVPLIQYSLRNPGIFFKRTEETFILNHLSDVSSVKAIWENIVEHLLMFHISGDPNPRHNLPFEPMLDDVTGTLFIAGLILILAQWRRPLFLLFPCWVFVMLAPGIFSVPWESPQSLRSIGVIPAVLIISIVPLVYLSRLFNLNTRGIFRKGGLFSIVILFGVIGYFNVSTYFGEQASHPDVFADFSTSETLMAKEMVKQSQNGYTLFSSRQFLYSLTASVVSGNVYYEPLFAPRDLPISPDRVLHGAAIYLEPREAGIYDLLAGYYPSAKFREIMAPHGGDPILYEVLINKQQLTDSLGVEVNFKREGALIKTDKFNTFSSSWFKDLSGIDLPADFVFQSNLHVRQPGFYRFKVSGDGQLFLDDISIQEDGKGIKLGVGLHSVTLEGTAHSESGFTELLWSRDGGIMEAIPSALLFSGERSPMGLAGVFYQESEPLISHVGLTADTFYYDPPIEGPYEAIWAGFLEIPISAAYKFSLTGNGAMKLFVNDVLVTETTWGSEFAQSEEISIHSGKARIELQYLSSTGSPQFEINWQMGENAENVIPVSLIKPDPEFMRVP